MPLFGAHLSIVGGLHNAVASAVELRCETLQIFTKNANTWAASPLKGDEVRVFRDAVAASRLRHVTAHDSYLINVASPDDKLFVKSIAALVTEMECAESLGLSYLVMHPGAHVGSGEEAGLARAIAGLDEVHARCPGFAVQLLVETTAGQGSSLGYRFEQIATIFECATCADRMGVCFDTCHVFAAGYPLAAEADYRSTMQQFDSLIGLPRLKLFHINDSAKPLGSRVDRHAGIGLGQIGLDAFRRLVTDPRFKDHPMILETPKGDDDRKGSQKGQSGTRGRFTAPGTQNMDVVNLNVLRGLVAAPGSPPV